MAIHVDCPECGQEYRLRDELAGKKFACKSCQTAVTIPAAGAKKTVRKVAKVEEPAPSKNDDDFDWDTPLGETAEIGSEDSAEAMPALPPVSRKKKKKPAQRAAKKEDDDRDDDDGEDGAMYRRSSSGWMIAGFPLPIVISLACNAILWLWVAFLIFDFLRYQQPINALKQIFRIGWLTWLMYDLSNGAMRARYLSILESISGLTWAAVMWMVFIPLMALSPLVKDQPWVLTLIYASATISAGLWTINIIALCMPSAAEHCSEWEGG